MLWGASMLGKAANFDSLIKASVVILFLSLVNVVLLFQ